MVVSPAFVFKTTDMPTIFEGLQQWRGQLSDLTYDTVSKLLATEVTKKFDDPMAKGELSGGNIAYNAYDKMNKRMAACAKSDSRDPDYDLRFDLAIYSFEHKLYGVVYTEHSEWVKGFKALGLTNDFSYWNNTDGPSHVTEDEWNHRQYVWDGVFSSKRFGNNNLVAHCASYDVKRPSRKSIVENIPSFHDRCSRIAKQTVMNRKMALDDDIGDPTDTGDFSRRMFRCQDWMKTDVGQTMIGIEIGHLKSLLHPAITEDML
jgi:hypothetical protein